jgi:hypothetical protein
MLPNSHYPEPGLSYGPLISPTFQPAAEEGVSLDDLAVGAVVEVVTGHHTYRLENRGGGEVLISGHPVYCPEPVLVELHGSVGDSGVIKMWFIGRGMRLEFRHPALGLVQTSRVREIHELTAAQ